MRRCPHCGLGNLYRDDDGGFTCLSCARSFDARLESRHHDGPATLPRLPRMELRPPRPGRQKARVLL